MLQIVSTLLRLIVLGVEGRRAELCALPDHLFHGIQPILFRRQLAPPSDRKHPSLCRDRFQLCTGTIRTQSSDQAETDVTFARHASCVDLEDAFAAFEVGQAEFDFTVETSGA